MAAKPLTSEAIALTEKKMDMTLDIYFIFVVVVFYGEDDIIKMSKNPSSKTKKQRRVPNKSQKAFRNAVQDKAFKVRQYMGSRSAVRQGVLAQRRSNFQDNHFPMTTEVARKATYAPARNRAFGASMLPDKTNRARVGALPVQRRSNGDFAKSQQQDNAVNQQRPQTLDSLFANMKEQRLKVFSSQSNNNGGGQRNNAPQRHGGVRRNGVQRNGVQRNGGGRPQLPWVRGRLGN